jgi:hypothetical protein
MYPENYHSFEVNTKIAEKKLKALHFLMSIEKIWLGHVS